MRGATKSKNAVFKAFCYQQTVQKSFKGADGITVVQEKIQCLSDLNGASTPPPQSINV